MLDFGIVFWAGLLGGVVTLGGKKEAQRIGFRTGLVGALPIVWQAVSTVDAVLHFDQPVFFGALEVLIVFVLIAFVAVMVGVSGALAAMIGRWLSRKFGPRKPEPVSS